MASRTPKRNTSKKQSAAVRRTKKSSTPVKKAPPKKSSPSGNKAVIPDKKTPKKPPKTGKTGNNTVISGNKSSKKPHKAVPKNFVKISANASNSKFNEMGDKVRNGEIRWAFYSEENNVGQHYYEIL